VKRSPIHFATALICTIAVVAGCSDVVETNPPRTALPVPSAASALPTPPLSSNNAEPTGAISTALTCGSLFTPPPYGFLTPVDGIGVRAVDKGHFEIQNTASQRYFFAIFSWVTEGDLVCGRGVVAQDGIAGSVDPGSSMLIGGGSTTEVPVTVSIWPDPCGEGCVRAPIAEYLVPISTVEPPPSPIL
jgi:hypothetical protein